MEMYSRYNERKSVVAERFIRTLKTNIYKHMITVSKNVYIDKLDDIVNEFNNTYHQTIKMKPVDVKDNTYIGTSRDINDRDPKFKVDDHVRISKYKNIFAIKMSKIQLYRHMVLMISMVKKLLEYFMKENYKKQTNKNLKFIKI